MPRGPELSHSSAAQFTRARAAVNLFLHDALQSEGHEVAIATIAPLDETRIILGPPYEHTSHQGAVRSQPHHRLRHLLDAQHSRWYGAFDAVGNIGGKTEQRRTWAFTQQKGRWKLSSSRPGCKLRVTVELFRRAWLGIVSGVCVPSGLCLTNAMCSRSLTIRKPRDPSAFITRFLGASTGNFTTKLRPRLQQ